MKKMPKEQRSQHYAAAGRTITACGLSTASPNSYANAAFSSNSHNPKCKACHDWLGHAERCDVVALVRCSEDGKPTAQKQATKAVKEAQALAHKLGPLWQPQVWENLGWHWCVVCKGLCIGPSGKGYFLTSNVARACFHVNGNTLQQTIRVAREYIDDVVAQYTKAQAFLPPL